MISAFDMFWNVFVVFYGFIYVQIHTVTVAELTRSDSACRLELTLRTRMNGRENSSVLLSSNFEQGLCDLFKKILGHGQYRLLNSKSAHTQAVALFRISWQIFLLHRKFKRLSFEMSRATSNNKFVRQNCEITVSNCKINTH